jgi:hypothetical protein
MMFELSDLTEPLEGSGDQPLSVKGPRKPSVEQETNVNSANSTAQASLAKPKRTFTRRVARLAKVIIDRGERPGGPFFIQGYGDEEGWLAELYRSHFIRK